MQNIPHQTEEEAVTIRVPLEVSIHKRLKMSAAEEQQTVPERAAAILDAALPVYEKKESNAAA